MRFFVAGRSQKFLDKTLSYLPHVRSIIPSSHLTALWQFRQISTESRTQMNNDNVILKNVIECNSDKRFEIFHYGTSMIFECVLFFVLCYNLLFVDFYIILFWPHCMFCFVDSKNIPHFKYVFQTIGEWMAEIYRGHLV